MAYTSVNLPVPAADGVGAAQNVNTMGKDKLLIISGTLRGASIIVEASGSAAGDDWVQVSFVTKPAIIPLDLVARRMRARVRGLSAADAVFFSADVDIAGDDGTTPSFATLTAPAGNGAGASVDTSTIPGFRTIWVGGVFTGSVSIEGSPDDVTFATLGHYLTRPGFVEIDGSARYLRVRREGVIAANPGLPLVNVGGVSVGGGGGGIGGDLEDAYNFGGAGAGRSINVAAGLPVEIIAPGNLALSLRPANAANEYSGFRFADAAGGSLWTLGNDWLGNGDQVLWLYDSVNAVANLYFSPSENTYFIKLGYGDTWGSVDYDVAVERLQIAVSKTGAVPGQLELDVSQVVMDGSGLVSEPDYSWDAEQTSGFYRPGAGQIAVSILSSQRALFSAQGIGIPSGGAVGTPTLFVIGNVDVGISNYTGGNNLSIHAGVNECARFNPSGVWTLNGGALAPSYSFINTTDMGMYRDSATQLAFGVGGAPRLYLDDDTTASQTPLLLMVAGGAPQRVSVGAADSGGAGFRVLRVAN